MTLLPTLVAALILLAIRARYERRDWDRRTARAGVRAANEMRALRTVMYPDDEALRTRETDWYINNLMAATSARPTQGGETA